MFNKILVAVDQSDASHNAAELAIRLAKSDNAQLLLLSVLDVSKLIAVAGYEAPYPVDAIAMLKDANEQLLRETGAECIAQGVKAETLMAEGDACDEILRVAQEQHVGLICVGTHGRKGLSRLFLGSVAEGVLRRSPVPVLATRPPALSHETAAEMVRPAAAPATN